MGRPDTATIRLLFSGLLFFMVLSGHTQFYNKGEDPGYLKWRQIRTGHFKVVYPEGFDHEAQRLTNILEYYYEPNALYLETGLIGANSPLKLENGRVNIPQGSGFSWD